MKRNNEVCEKAENLLKDENANVDELKQTLKDVLVRYKECSYKEYSDKEDFYSKCMETMVNDFGFNEDKFVDNVLKWHRTLQQSFFNICISAIRKFAKLENWQIDGRNEYANKIAKILNNTLEENGCGKCPMI